ncbi:Putative TrmH family tRNA/rRNA methyltransferase [Sphingobacterium daejeonense]|nr:Putative TrmH family tRNA/rRNA methyltransferase [Sphingobacterium daejeonense]
MVFVLSWKQLIVEKEIESLFVQRGLSGPLFAEFKALVKEHNISFQQVPIEKLNRITRKNHQGIIAVISPITYQDIEDLLPVIYEKGETPLLLMLDGVTDVRNMGANCPYC